MQGEANYYGGKELKVAPNTDDEHDSFVLGG